jgi:mono/diheme cytochrome c family protein
MFKSYCATCHGAAGKGNGPAAAALKKPPADLTTISARNGGKFPEAQVNRTIMGLDALPSHGTTEMPIWGPLFRSLEPNDRSAAELRARNLTEYLRSIQQ